MAKAKVISLTVPSQQTVFEGFFCELNCINLCFTQIYFLILVYNVRCIPALANFQTQSHVTTAIMSKRLPR